MDTLMEKWKILSDTMYVEKESFTEMNFQKRCSRLTKKKKKKVVARHDVPMHSFMEGFFIILDNGWTCQTPRMASCYPTVHSYVLCR